MSQVSSLDDCSFRVVSKCLCLCHCICLCYCLFVGQVMAAHHSDQMSQRSQVSRTAHWGCSLNVFVFVFVYVYVPVQGKNVDDWTWKIQNLFREKSSTPAPKHANVKDWVWQMQKGQTRKSRYRQGQIQSPVKLSPSKTSNSWVLEWCLISWSTLKTVKLLVIKINEVWCQWLKLLSRSKSETWCKCSIGQFIQHPGIIAERVRAKCTMAAEFCHQG